MPSWKKPRSPPLLFDGPSENSKAKLEKLSGFNLASLRILFASVFASFLDLSIEGSAFCEPL